LRKQISRFLGRVADRLEQRGRGRRLRSSRMFAAAVQDRLTSSWIGSNATADVNIRAGLNVMRARSRELVANNDYARRFISLLKTNVIGPDGIKLQSQALLEDGKSLDDDANNKIEKAWKDWGRVGVCSVDGRMSWIDCQKMFVSSLATDGEVLIRKYKNPRVNEFGFAIQFIEADHLDVNLNQDLKNGNRIRLGIETDSFGRPVAYWLRMSHPGESMGSTRLSNYQRVPAEEIIHAFILDRPTQYRGVPWMVSAMRRLNHLGSYEEAELIAARIGASKMGFFESGDGDGYEGDDTDDDGSVIMEAEPGTFEQLPEGVKFSSWEPDHPTTAFPNFVKACLRGVASGLNVSYVGLANDLEGVSYSSIRQGELADRDAWKVLQVWAIEHLLGQIFPEWFNSAELNGMIKLGSMSQEKRERYLRPSWRPRGFAWVDPLKEVRANFVAVQNGFKSIQDIVGEQGGDIEDVFKQKKREKDLADLYELELPVITGGVTDDGEGPPPEQNTPEGDNENES